jgi:glyoxylase I family protein
VIKVTGIGGFFFRAKNPEALEKWYSDNLGVAMPPKSYDDPVWVQETGLTVFQPFQHDTDYFGDDHKQWMLNFRVGDLDALVQQIRDNGNPVEVDPETYPNGRFARVYDPEGNPIQLWEPSGDDPD